MRVFPHLCRAVALLLCGQGAYAQTGNTEKVDGQGQWKVGQPVRTTSGTIVGHPAGEVPGVSEYLGIKFAKAAVGQLRFAAPQPYFSNDTYVASTYSPDCPTNILGASVIAPVLNQLVLPQAINILSQIGQVNNNQSEDCLALNIWTKPQTGSKLKPVLFWIYGGGFNSGSTNNKATNGEFFANSEDVVIVSANYRVNILGFPGVPGVPGVAQNPGLLDQRLAVEWVERNIAGFGGDPRRITLFGQSAGAASVDYYQYAWTERPIVQGFIQESGTAQSFYDPPLNNNLEGWWNATMKLGCGGPEVPLPEQVECMRTRDFHDIETAIQASDPLKAVLGSFGPTVDYHVVFNDYSIRGATGRFIRKPLLIGSNFNEAGLFKIFALAGGNNVSESQWAIFNQALFECPTAKAAGYRVQNRVDVWRYLYFGDFPNLALTFNPPSGAYHTAEISVVFETSAEFSGVPNTRAETSISRYLNGVWASFARNPQYALRSERYSYPEYNPFTRSLLLFALDNRTLPYAAFPVQFDYLCPLLESIAAITPGGLPAIVNNGFNSNSTLPILIGDDGDDGDDDGAQDDAFKSGKRRKLTPKERQQFRDYMAMLRGDLPPGEDAPEIPSNSNSPSPPKSTPKPHHPGASTNSPHAPASKGKSPPDWGHWPSPGAKGGNTIGKGPPPMIPGWPQGLPHP